MSALWTSEWTVSEPRTEPLLRDRRLSSEGRETAARLTRRRLLEVQELQDGLRVSTRSFVGSVRLDDLVLHVRPKIDDGTVPTFMRYALGLDAVSVLDRTGVPVRELGFVDLLGLVLLEEVDRILHAGLFQDYRETSAWLSAPRGKLVFAELARHPHRPRIEAPCRFTHRTADVLPNRLMLAALTALRAAVSDLRLRGELHAREALLREFCRPEPLTLGLLAEARSAMDRRSAYYMPVVSIAELILGGAGPQFDDERATPLPGFLFDMNALFERFVARLCREHSPPGLRIETQESLAVAYRYRTNPHRWPAPRLRPDLVVRTPSGKPCLVLDTKYKLLAGIPPSAADLYQLTIYSMSFGSGTPVPARIVYPCLGPPDAEPVLDFYGFEGNQPLGSVGLAGLDLQRCASALENRRETELRALASRLLAPPTDADR